MEETKASEISLELKTDDEVNVTSNGNHRVKIKLKRKMKGLNKVIRNGKVAVAISSGFGAGWTTWNSEISPFEPKVIQMIEKGMQSEITEKWCEENLGIKDIYCGGVFGLEIEWVNEGLMFSINEYDGSESLYTEDELKYKA